MAVLRFILIFLCLAYTSQGFAQLQDALIKANDLKNSSPSEALKYAQEAEKIAKQGMNERGMADSYAIMGYLQGMSLDRPDLAYEYHEKAYTLYKRLYNQGYLDNDAFYHFLNEEAIPTYKYVVGVESRKKRYKKAIQHYEQLNAKMAIDLANIAEIIRKELEAKQREVKAKEAKIAETDKTLKEKDKKLATTQDILEKKKMTEVTLIAERQKLQGTLSGKEEEAMRLIDSLYDERVKLQMEQTASAEAKTKQAEAEKSKAVSEKASLQHKADLDRQRGFIILMLIGGGLGIGLFFVIAAALIQQRKAAAKIAKQRDLLSAKNIEITQQQEEILAQSENISQQNAQLQQQTEEITAQRDNLEKQHQLLEKQKFEIEKQRDESNQLLLNILPAEVADELKNTGKATPQSYDMVTVLFTDFKGFTKIAEKLTPEQIVTELDRCFLAFDEILEKYDLEKIKTMGDGYMCAGGLPIANKTNPIDAVRAGLAMLAFMEELKKEKEAKGEPIWELRLGIHTGPVVAGVVGKKKFVYDIWGDTVNVASRMESSGEAGKVNISEATYEYVKSYFNCVPRGKIMAKNKGEIEMYFVEGQSSLLQGVQNLINQ
jgi:class 3 adenylate cyclase